MKGCQLLGEEEEEEEGACMYEVGVSVARGELSDLVTVELARVGGHSAALSVHHHRVYLLAKPTMLHPTGAASECVELVQCVCVRE